MAQLDLRPYLLNVLLFPGGDGVIPLELRAAPSNAVVTAFAYNGTGNDATRVEANMQPVVDSVDPLNWTITFAADKTRRYSSQNPYSLDILVNNVVVASGSITSSREPRQADYVAGAPIVINWGTGQKAVLTPLGALDQAYFNFSITPATNNMQLEHNLNCDDIETVAYDADGQRLFDVVAYPLKNQVGVNYRNVAKLALPVGVIPAYLYIKPLFR